jgi:hypothetical protein
MSDTWQTLRAGGVPLAIEPAVAVPSPAILAAMARAAIATASGRDAEALAAWIFAWAHHWPSSFAASFAADHDQVLAWAARAAIDDNRYLKLRRIALENLATIL